eukprot:9484190-Pyramimonas_sp.AAC.1
MAVLSAGGVMPDLANSRNRSVLDQPNWAELGSLCAVDSGGVGGRKSWVTLCGLLLTYTSAWACRAEV